MIHRTLRILLSLASLALLPGVSAQQAGTSPVKIFVMIGQSNMLGKGTITGETTPGTLEYVVANDPGNHYQFLKSGGNWVVRDDVWIRDQDPVIGGLTVGFGGEAAGLIGPELGFGHHVGDLYEQQILIVKCAWGGKSLGNDFLPPSSGPYPTPLQAGDAGFYYQEVLRLVGEATANLATYFPDYNAAGGYEIAGICWHQGWNDRVTGPFADAYEVNMANFINDIRSSENGLGVPDLPFVIATTGMDGNPDVYTTVEIAQKKMDNSTGEHPTFAGNVAVVDTRTSYSYDNAMELDFWQPAADSPASEGYHWNRNAKTYLHIGLAMGDAMSAFVTPRCPYRLRATPGNPGGMVLSWENGTETPTSVRVLRGGSELAAAAPVSPATFVDSAAEPGLLSYQLEFTMPGSPCDPLTLTYEGGITGAEAFRAVGGVGLTWQNNMAYDAIQISRGATVIEPSFSGSATSYIDTGAPTSGLVTYSMVPTNGSATPATDQINLDGAPYGNALIYEPFDYPVGELNGQSGISEVGLEGSYAASDDSPVIANSLSYGALPVAGNSFGSSASNSRFGGARAVRASALAANGLLDDGSILWFSAIVGYGTGGNRTNARLAIALANNSFSTGNNNYNIRNGGTGSGVGLTLGNISGSGKVVATQFTDGSSGGSGDNVLGTQPDPLFTTDGAYGLIIGKIEWGATADTITLYYPGTDLELPVAPISTLTVDVDQSGYDTLTWTRGDLVLLDEIRFGSNYSDVVGGAVAIDEDPPTPNPAAFFAAPAADSDSAISMTAETGTDDSGPIEYLFSETSDNPGATSSGWQTSPNYTDDGLNPATSYSYTVTMRDRYGNTGAASAAASATTDAPDNDAPTPDPMTWASPPAAISASQITMTANPASDPSGVEYYFTCISGGGHDSDWQDSRIYTDSGLTPSTSYSYKVKARDKSANLNQTANSTPSASATTNPPSGLSTLEIGEQHSIAGLNGTSSFNVSVNGAFQGYNGTGTEPNGSTTIAYNEAFNGTVEAYRFWTASSTAISTLTQSGGIINDIVTIDTAFQTQSAAHIFESTDPNYPLWNTTQNFTANIGNFNDGGTGSIDISGISAGSVYFFYGAYRSTASLSVTMGALSIAELHDSGDFSNNNEYYVARVDFVNDDGYTSIDWTLASGFNGRFSGIVVTSSPVALDYAAWIAGFSGLGSETGFDDDPDKDNLKNGLENYFGTHPGTFNAGLNVLQLSGGTFTFSHPISDTPADDITASYKWSTDLSTFHDSGATVNGTTVSFVSGSPSGGMVDVAANITGTVPDKIFVRLEVLQLP